MSQYAIEMRQIGKRYQRGKSIRYLSLRDELGNAFINFIKGKNNENQPAFWALKDIHLSIEKGDRVGIIGNNGAGKSTLLKIISRITPPTSGEVIIRGSVGSLLEIGTGFHTELTGLDNIYVYGAILGLKRQEINNSLKEIIEFSGVGDYIHTPLKHYSSGMHMRLGFSVASHLQAEILLVDEVLSVGDYEFQQRCIGKMNQISAHEGRTIVFVSHDLTAIGNLTKKSILLEKGKIISYDSTPKVLDEYLNRTSRDELYTSRPNYKSPNITRVEILNTEAAMLKFGSSLIVDIDVFIPELNTSHMALSVQVIHEASQTPINHFHIFDIEKPILRKNGLNSLQLSVDNFNLFRGKYFLRVYLAESRTKTEFERIDCCYFSVEMIGMPDIEWGWQENMCRWLPPYNWKYE